MQIPHQKSNSVLDLKALFKSIPFALFLALSFLALTLMPAQKTFAAEKAQWQLESVESEDVQVWTKAVLGSDFKAFKGQVTIAAPLKTVLKVIKDHQSYPEWYHQNKLTQRLKVISEQQNLTYTITKTPWPVSDRDSVVLATQKTLDNGDIKIELKAQPKDYPLQADMIRIEKLTGYWLLEKQINKEADKKEMTKVTLEITAEPGGEIPSWVANSMVIDMPFNTLSNLKERLEN